MKINNLAFISGIDIPFIEGGFIIHQPKIKEIGYIGEDDFFLASDALLFSKDKLEEKDKILLSNKDDFDILMSMMALDEFSILKEKVNSIFPLFFPDCNCTITETGILIMNENFNGSINKYNFEEFKKVFSRMLCMNGKRGKGSKDDYDPANERAKKIAEKLKKGREKAAAARGEDINNKELDMLGKYSSILSIGTGLDLNVILNYTIYQLFYQFERYGLKTQNDLYIQAQLAGAEGLKEVDSWMDSIQL